MNKASKLFLASLIAAIITAGFVVSHNYKEFSGPLKAWYYCTGEKATGMLGDGMKQAMMTARDEIQDAGYSARDYRKNGKFMQQ